MHQNITIQSDLDAWLTFLSTDSPEKILELIQYSSEFRDMYQEIYDICENVEEVMHMFSKELREMDRNTVKLMIEEQEKELEEQKKLLAENRLQLEEHDRLLAESDKKLAESDKQLAEKDALIAELQKQLEAYRN